MLLEVRIMFSFINNLYATLSGRWNLTPSFESATVFIYDVKKNPPNLKHL